MGRIPRRFHLVYALNVGAIHVGWTGNAPPIFGQAAGAAILYVAALPPGGEGVRTKSDSGINAIADLKGKKAAVAKGTFAHNGLIAAHKGNSLKLTDIEPVYPGPAAAVAEVTKDPLDANQLAVSRAKFGIFSITEQIIAGQQATADRFFALGLLPKAVKIADAVWKAPS
jgi:ABC-type nitrate/sulfonate/bicarbonate transport system substrate-binding protein